MPYTQTFHHLPRTTDFWINLQEVWCAHPSIVLALGAAAIFGTTNDIIKDSNHSIRNTTTELLNFFSNLKFSEAVQTARFYRSLSLNNTPILYRSVLNVSGCYSIIRVETHKIEKGIDVLLIANNLLSDTEYAPLEVRDYLIIREAQIILSRSNYYMRDVETAKSYTRLVKHLSNTMQHAQVFLTQALNSAYNDLKLISTRRSISHAALRAHLRTDLNSEIRPHLTANTKNTAKAATTSALISLQAFSDKLSILK
jgi:hypothetical protein